MIWTMKKEAFRYKKSFEHTPGASKRPKRWVFNILMQNIWHFSKNCQNQFWPMLKYAKFDAEFEFDIRFYWNYLFCYFFFLHLFFSFFGLFSRISFSSRISVFSRISFPSRISRVWRAYPIAGNNVDCVCSLRPTRPTTDRQTTGCKSRILIFRISTWKRLEPCGTESYRPLVSESGLKSMIIYIYIYIVYYIIYIYIYI